MPHIMIKVPAGTFTVEQRARVNAAVTQVAMEVEQIGNAAHQRGLCWVMIEELAPGCWTCGAVDVSAQLVPCIVLVKVPAGVLNDTMRRDYVQRLHQALGHCRAADDQRPLMTSIIIEDVDNGAWGANGKIWQLADFAQAAGYRHLQGVSPA